MPRSIEEKIKEIRSFKVGDNVSFGVLFSDYSKDGTMELEGKIVEIFGEEELNKEAFIKTEYGVLKERLTYLSKANQNEAIKNG